MEGKVSGAGRPAMFAETRAPVRRECAHVLLLALAALAFRAGAQPSSQRSIPQPAPPFGVQFVLALPYDPATEYRESHASACTRVGMAATPARAYLGLGLGQGAGRGSAGAGGLQLNTSSPTWDAAYAQLAVTAHLGPASNATVAQPFVRSCCSPTIFCGGVRDNATAAGGGGGGSAGHPLECWSTGLGGAHYENFGWLAPSPSSAAAAAAALPLPSNDTSLWRPVFTCQPLALPLLTVSGSLVAPSPGAPTSGAGADGVPIVGIVGPVAARATSRADTGNYPARRLVVDGLNLGVEVRDLSVTVGGQPCLRPDVCHSMCAACTDNSDCGSDKICVRYSRFASPVCVRPCNDDGTCPCGAACQPVGSGGGSGQISFLCLAPGLLFSDPICAMPVQPNPWVPPPNSSLTDRIECDAPQGVFGQALLPEDDAAAVRASALGRSQSSGNVRRLRDILDAAARNGDLAGTSAEDEGGEAAAAGEEASTTRGFFGWRTGNNKARPKRPVYPRFETGKSGTFGRVVSLGSAELRRVEPGALLRNLAASAGASRVGAEEDEQGGGECSALSRPAPAFGAAGVRMRGAPVGGSRGLTGYAAAAVASARGAGALLGGGLGEQPGWAGPPLSPAPLAGAFRYSSVSLGDAPQAVVVVRGGLASTGLGAALASSLGIKWTATASPVPPPPFPPFPAGSSFANDSSLWFFAGLGPLSGGGGSGGGGAGPYSQVIPSWKSTFAACASDAECPVVDACTVPRCAAAGAGGTAKRCTYAASGPWESCATSSASLPEGEMPNPTVLFPLPRSVAGALPMPPPPNGTVGLPQASWVADPTARTPATFRRGIDWDPSSVWFSRSSPAGQASFAPAAVEYLLAPASWGDDGPMDRVGLAVFPTLQPASGTGPTFRAAQPWTFPFAGSNATGSLWVSANGYIRAVGAEACRGTFLGSQCGFDDEYAGIIAPILADFFPGQYDASEIWVGQFDLSALSIAYLNGSTVTVALGQGSGPAGSTSAVPLSAASLLALSVAAPASRMMCMTASEMGLYTVPGPPRALPPSPSFNAHLCVAGDGSVRWRYGAIFGSPQVAAGAWNANTVVAARGGAPNGTDWLSGVRSLATSWDEAILSDSFGEQRNASVGIPLVGGAGVTHLQYAGKVAPADGFRGPNASVASSALPLSSSLDFALSGTQQVILGRDGVRPGATVAMCALSTVACTNQACGSAGTAVSLAWAGAGCGPGFEVFLPQVIRAGGLGFSVAATPQTPRIECVFGSAAPVPAVWAAYDAVLRVGQLSCVAPAMDASASNSSAGGTRDVTVPLRIQLVLPATNAAVNALGPGVVTGEGAPPPDATAIAAALGVGVSDGVFDPSTGMLSLPLPVHGARLVGPYGGGAYGVAAAPLAFTYAGTSSGCGGCGAGAGSVCDVCGVCSPGGLVASGASAARDCAGVCLGRAVIDDCGVCSAGTMPRLPNADKDCSGECFGKDRSCFPTPTPTPSPWTPFGDNLTNAVLYLVIIVTPCLFCSAGVLYLSSIYCANSAARRRGGEATIRALEREPELLGIHPGLSDEHLERLPLVEYDAESATFKNVPGGGDACPVCMEDFTAGEHVRLLPPCGHAGHLLCFDTWFTRSTTCPVCRAELRTADEIEADAAERRARAVAITRERMRAAARGMPPPNAVMPQMAGGAQQQQQQQHMLGERRGRAGRRVLVAQRPPHVAPAAHNIFPQFLQMGVVQQQQLMAAAATVAGTGAGPRRGARPANTRVVEVEMAQMARRGQQQHQGVGGGGGGGGGGGASDDTTPVMTGDGHGTVDGAEVGFDGEVDGGRGRPGSSFPPPTQALAAQQWAQQRRTPPPRSSSSSSRPRDGSGGTSPPPSSGPGASPQRPGRGGTPPSSAAASFGGPLSPQAASFPPLPLFGADGGGGGGGTDALLPVRPETSTPTGAPRLTPRPPPGSSFRAVGGRRAET